MASNQQVSVRSVMTIRVGAGSNLSDTSSGGTARVEGTPSVAAAADDVGSHGNPSQQPSDDTRSAVTITLNQIITFRGIARGRGGRGRPPQAAVWRGRQNMVIRGHKASDGFWGLQNCGPPGR